MLTSKTLKQGKPTHPCPSILISDKWSFYSKCQCIKELYIIEHEEK